MKKVLSFLLSLALIFSLAWAVDSGIMGGVSATELAPRGTATRAQVVTILWRYFQQAEEQPSAPEARR